VAFISSYSSYSSYPSWSDFFLSLIAPKENRANPR